MTAPTLNGVSEKGYDPDVMKRTVQEIPPGQGFFSSGSEVGIFYMGQAADGFEPWGRATKTRDLQLRAFFPTEPLFLSGLGMISSRNSSFSWKLEGPEEPVGRFQTILEQADFGAGWARFIGKLTVDLATQDYGAFYEIIRAKDSPDAEVLGIAHLDAWRCYPTGIPEFPVVYLSRTGKWQKLPWYSVQHILDMPAPVETLPELGICALTRMLRAVQIMKDIGIYISEKIGGRNYRAVTLLKGVTSAQVEEAWQRAQLQNDAVGLTKFSMPLMVGTVDPKADIGFSTFEVASLPDAFDLDLSQKQYILQMALAFMEDYQTFAPLPGGGLGTSTQSQVLHDKSRGKGAGLFQNLIRNSITWNVLPKSVEFVWDEQDSDEDAQMATTANMRATTRSLRITSGELTVNVARQLAIEAGDLTEEQAKAMEIEDKKRAEEEAAAQQAQLDQLNAQQQLPPGQKAPLKQLPPGSPAKAPQKTTASEGNTRSATKEQDDRAGDPKVEQARLDVEEHATTVVAKALADVRKRMLANVAE